VLAAGVSSPAIDESFATARQARGIVPWIGSPCSSTGTIASAPRRSTLRPSAS
jgi:hypothetical protein